MSNPTTPFSWQMPTATDLVTDLPADFEVFGQAVATSMADLLGGTTGQVLSKTSNTNMDFTWVAPTTGDITGVTAGTGISGGGTSGDVTVTNSMATAITTSGDLIQGTGSGTFARLGTGTNGQYLTTNGTTNSWAAVPTGGMTLISTTTLTGASTTISSIPATYNNLVLHIRNFRPATNNQDLRFYFNGDNGANRYYTNSGSAYNTTGGNVLFNVTQINTGDSTSSTTNNGEIFINIYDYTNSGTWKTAEITTTSSDGTTPTLLRRILSYGTYNQTGAISSITFVASSGNLSAGSALLYGVK